MATGIRGTFVLSLRQIEIDGMQGQSSHALRAGSTWSWEGRATRVDGPGELLTLDLSEADIQLRRRAGRVARRLLDGRGAAARAAVPDMEPVIPNSFVLTDGLNRFTAMLASGRDGQEVVIFENDLPPAGRMHWVVSCNIDPLPARADNRGMICFTPGTVISTPRGPKLIEALREGDLVSTRDSGPREILWMGRRRLSGARLALEPDLCPVCIGPGSFGIQRPDQSLLVSPDHRLLLRGGAARALFNTSEVLVCARDLLNGTTVTRATGLRSVEYIHLMLATHEVIWANRVETESFHPGSADFSELDPGDRSRLLSGLTGVRTAPETYGPHARRSLSKAEAAILLHDAA
ncbi:Hint domain-containing protein [Pseudooceanicola sp. C21-150M6]|uniref:Hint domain-containing protein n=1 Tax=Pseudooceanicola sp. C21-150M6 TaxID=3434355 RepID=UPI003D7FAACB